MKKSAFTLIELLVVIAIIAVLAAIAIPVYGTAMEKAHGIADLANLKQLGIGMQQYLNDNEGIMFSQTPASGANGVTLSWSQTLQSKYLPDWRVFRSPFDNRPDKSITPIPLSYGINKNAMTPAASSATTGSTTTFNGDTSQFVSPSELIIIAPSPTNAAGDTPKFTATATDNSTVAPLPITPRLGTHGRRGLINVLYADWHSSQLLWKDFSDATSVPNGQHRWQPLGGSQQQQQTGGS